MVKIGRLYKKNRDSMDLIDYKDEYDYLEKKYEELSQRHDTVIIDYTDLKAKYENLNEQFKLMEENFWKERRENTRLQTALNAIKSLDDMKAATDARIRHPEDELRELRTLAESIAEGVSHIKVPYTITAYAKELVKKWEI